MLKERAGKIALVWLLLAGAVTPLHAGTVLVLRQTVAQLTAIDSETLETRASLDLDKGPANLAIAPDGLHAYVAHSDIGRVSVVDLARWQVSTRYAAPGAPFGLAVAPSGKLYVGDWNSSSIHELDAASGAALRAVEIGKAPAHLALARDSRHLLAVAREANTVSIVDTKTFTIETTVQVQRAPFALAVSPDSTRALVANAQAGSISTVDLSKNAVTATTRVGAMPYGVAFAENTGVAMVTNQQSGTLSFVDQTGAAQGDRLKVGNYPEGIAITQDGSLAFVTNWFSDDVSVVDVATRKEKARLKLSGGPRAIAIVEGSFGR